MNDAFDRKILSELVRDSSLSYAALGQKVGLSPPAVHERVKRLRKSGVLKATTAQIDAAALGKPFLAFIHVNFVGWGKSRRLLNMAAFPEVEEMHSVAGDAGMILKVRTTDSHALEQLLSQLYGLAGVSSTKSYIVLSTFLERPTQADSTDDWPEMLLVED